MQFKWAQPRVRKEQAPHLRWEQLEPGVVDAPAGKWLTIFNDYLKVSINGGTPKWLVYKGNPIKKG